MPLDSRSGCGSVCVKLLHTACKTGLSPCHRSSGFLGLEAGWSQSTRESSMFPLSASHTPSRAAATVLCLVLLSPSPLQSESNGLNLALPASPPPCLSDCLHNEASSCSAFVPSSFPTTNETGSGSSEVLIYRLIVQRGDGGAPSDLHKNLLHKLSIHSTCDMENSCTRKNLCSQGTVPDYWEQLAEQLPVLDPWC